MFGVHSPMCMECLNELLKQQVINEKVHGQKLIDGPVSKLTWKCLEKKTVADSDMLIDVRISGVLDPQVFLYRL